VYVRASESSCCCARRAPAAAGATVLWCCGVVVSRGRWQAGAGTTPAAVEAILKQAAVRNKVADAGTGSQNLLLQAALCECCVSCPVLSCPVLSCPVLSCPVLSCPVLSCPVLSPAVLCYAVLPCQCASVLCYAARLPRHRTRVVLVAVRRCGCVVLSQLLRPCAGTTD
jgi:hypothetical protein